MENAIKKLVSISKKEHQKRSSSTQCLTESNTWFVEAIYNYYKVPERDEKWLVVSNRNVKPKEPAKFSEFQIFPRSAAY